RFRHRRLKGASQLRSADSTRSRKDDAVRRALRGESSTDTRDVRESGERAFLVGLDYRTRTRKGKRSLTASAQSARDAATSVAARSKPPSMPEFSADESLDELRTLATSAGATVVGEILQRRDRPDPATLIGGGKLEEISGAAASADADLILFDHDLSPSQQRNIERILHKRVIDRTQLILDIFA